jgi:tetratricopeptide (TPR) repeat protein
MAGPLERLQIALSGDLPHVLVLDGLERIQSEGATKRRGELEDPQLKRLVRALAGGVGNARALLTSRFALVDLENWNGAGHSAMMLDDLEQSSALEVLRAWRVKGDDSALIEAIEPLSIERTYHALSVAVLGSYIGNFLNGDAARAPQFVLNEAAEGDVKARKLQRILEEYSRALNQFERDLLARLALFPRGVRIEYLGWIAQAGGPKAGALAGQSNRELENHLRRLMELGLVFHYATGAEIVYSAHPFLRDFFRETLSKTDPKDVHESVRAKLRLSLESRPKPRAGDTALLDLYEFLSEQCLLSGRIDEAFNVYWNEVGGYNNLGRALGENARGLRMTERFFPQDEFGRQTSELSSSRQSALINALGLFALTFGELRAAEQAFEYGRMLDDDRWDWKNKSQACLNLAFVAQLGGQFRRVLSHAKEAINLAETSKDEARRCYGLVYRGLAHFALGEAAEAIHAFDIATTRKGEKLTGLSGVMEAECTLIRGDVRKALEQTHPSFEASRKSGFEADLCRCNALLARILKFVNPSLASKHLQSARSFAERSGEIELQLRCFQAACELAVHLGDLSRSVSEGESGIVLADGCGFGKYSSDIRIPLARAYLAANQYQKALQTARHALNLSEHPECQYAWGQADALHLCGIAHLRLGEPELARQRLAAALALRTKLTHPKTNETQRALGQLSGTGRAAST